jgi:hypothetical protein
MVIFLPDMRLNDLAYLMQFQVPTFSLVRGDWKYGFRFA